MNSIKTNLLGLLGLLFMPIANSSDVDPFVGKWCGKWDQTYQTCYTISKDGGSIDSKMRYSMLYEWQEQIDGGFNKKTIEGRQVNSNTIDFQGKIIILDLTQKIKKNAIGVGLFERYSRIALLKKIED
ncbi:MAG: hypothetical protein V2I33_02965 [Kangiellaceae bacterium]|jgi:hypothetical protein|nr:hypothetical protein [Kangiellaceae bacterium]